MSDQLQALLDKVPEVIADRLKVRPDDWGDRRDGAQAWAVKAVCEALYAAWGALSAHMLDALVATKPDPLEAWREWFGLEGVEAVVKAAQEMCPTWPSAEKARALLTETGWGAWSRGDPPAVLVVLSSAAACEWGRMKAGNVPWVHPLTLAPLARRPAKGGGTEGVPLQELVSARHPKGQVRMGIDALAKVWLPDEMPDYPETYWTAAMVLVVHLARKVWKQWKTGRQDYQRVRLAIGRNGRPVGIGDRIDMWRLLDMLTQVKAGGMRLVTEGTVNVIVGVNVKGGPEVELMVGDPLCPYGVTEWRKTEGIKLPSALNYNGAVLDPAWAPLVPGSDNRTLGVRVTAYSIGALAYGMSRREEYAEKGGVTFDGLPTLLRAMGLSLYKRTHSDLNERVIDAWKTPPTQLELGRPTTALWVPVEGDTKRWRLSDGHPEYVAAHEMILDASGVPARRRKQEAINQRSRQGKK
jgi:hypothetical protein